jgi:chemotaxis response regulator CheB
MTAGPGLTDATGTRNRPHKTAAPIRVAVLDDHAAVRAGLEAIVGSAPGMVSVGSARGEAELYWLLQRTDPSVLVLEPSSAAVSAVSVSR